VNTLIVIVSLIIVTWASAYTVSYGIWTIKQNKIGGIALIILSIACVVLPLYLLWIRK
jgi:hypothetical protein